MRRLIAILLTVYAIAFAFGALTAVRVGGRIADRARLGRTIDSILDDSADSYAQLRLPYVQNRRFQRADGRALAVDRHGDGLDRSG